MNRGRARSIPWDSGVVLTATERAAIVRSIQIFQLGESGGGKHFVHVGNRYAQQGADKEYSTALLMFVNEEHRHAEELGRVLLLLNAPRLQIEWSDRCFRWLRHRAGLELMISVLLTGEVMAQVYYAALRRATGSQLLERLCTEILRDEASHVRFQAERLALIRTNHSRFRRLLTRFCEQSLFSVACLVVWHGHKNVFRISQWSFRRFWTRAHVAFERSVELRDPVRI
jgi:hypothetical protein